MPQKRNNQEPPEVMTWGRATPVLVVSGIFDALSFMFDWFIFFGPALAGVICTVKASEYVGTAVGGLACGAGATVLGVVGVEVIAPFGIVMGMVTSFAGWLVVLIIFLLFNQRIFKENALWFGASLLVSEVPFVGSLPVITFVVWRMYRNQIRIERAEMKTFEKEQVERQLLERKQHAAQLMQARTAQLMQDEIY